MGAIQPVAEKYQYMRVERGAWKAYGIKMNMNRQNVSTFLRT